ncbi:hypothetical protein KQX54_002215 [Cotesia glomerata]|uniref:Phospholipase A2 n=2 Tax=Cotesia glomerata TaxID=32391 RepID=A0AAV7HRN5_COTGL|nr:hypothetical protein KQX54_002215 [Cotesia glomerata]
MMRSSTNFGMRVIFFVYLSVQINTVFISGGFVESNQKELEEILEIYSENNFEEFDQQSTRLSTIEEGLAGIKGSVKKIKSWIPNKWKNNLHSDEQESAPKIKFSDFVRQYSGKIRAIFPGTRWCGDGNIARDDTDLGSFKHTDACCRQHDKCPFNLESGETLGPLRNNGAFTRSWCACDQDFYNCLKAANNPIAREIGVTYFTVLGPQCIDYNFPATCISKSSVLDIAGRKCLEYKYDQSQKKIMQWKDSSNYVEILNRG